MAKSSKSRDNGANKDNGNRDPSSRELSLRKQTSAEISRDAYGQKNILIVASNLLIINIAYIFSQDLN